MPVKDPDELKLVIKAIKNHKITGSFEWLLKAAGRISGQLDAVTPREIRRLVCQKVAATEGIVEQRNETRPEWNEHRFYYCVNIDVDGSKTKLFVEMCLVDDDPDYPGVIIVNAHF